MTLTYGDFPIIMFDNASAHKHEIILFPSTTPRKTFLNLIQDPCIQSAS